MADDPNSTDQMLLDRAKAGDREAIDALVRRYANLVYGVALRQTGDPDLAGDVSQAVFIVFIRRIRSIHHARALAGWFMKTTQLVVRDARRSAVRREFHERHAARPEQIAMNPDPAPESSNLRLVDEAILSLPSTDRNLVLLRYMQGRELSAIAMDVGISEPTVRKRLSRAIEKIRRFFAARGATMSVVGVTGVLEAAGGQAAPAAVVQAAVAGAASGVAGVAGATTMSMSLASHVVQAMVWWKAKVMAGVMALAVLASAATVALVQEQPAPAPPPVAVQAGPMTPEQVLAQMNLHYAPREGEIIRIIPPPPPAFRDEWVLRQEVTNIRGVETAGITWSAEKGFQLRYWGSGGHNPGGAGGLLGLEWYEVEGLTEINWRNLGGDMVIADAAPRHDKLVALARFIMDYTGRPYGFITQKRRRPVIVVDGELRQGMFRRPDGFAVFVSQREPDEQMIAQSQGRRTPPGYQDNVGVDSIGYLMGVPLFSEPGFRDAPNVYLVAPDAQLHPSDPNYEAKIRRVIGNVQKQIGGQWRVEQREIETYVVDPAPPEHPARRVVSDYLAAVARNDGAAVVAQCEPGTSPQMVEIGAIMAVNQNFVTIDRISSDETAAMVACSHCVDESGRRLTVVFVYLRPDPAGNWRIYRVQIERDANGIAGTREEFLRSHPRAGNIFPNRAMQLLEWERQGIR